MDVGREEGMASLLCQVLVIDPNALESEGGVRGAASEAEDVQGSEVVLVRDLMGAIGVGGGGESTEAGTQTRFDF